MNGVVNDWTPARAVPVEELIGEEIKTAADRLHRSLKGGRITELPLEDKLRPLQELQDHITRLTNYYVTGNADYVAS